MLHDLNYSQGAPSNLAQSSMPPSSPSGLVQHLNAKLSVTLGTSGSVMPSSTWTSPLQALGDSLDHGLWNSHGGSHDPAVNSGHRLEQPLEDSIEEIPNWSVANHDEQRRPPNATYDRSGKITTLLIRYVPTRCTNTILMDEFHRQGFQGVYNFFYRPVDHRTKHHRTCAFVNFATPTIATAFYLKMHGRFLECAHDQDVPLEVSAAEDQGLESNATRYFTKKCEKRNKILAEPMFPALQHGRVLEVEAHARRLLLDSSNSPAVAACERSP